MSRFIINSIPFETCIHRSTLERTLERDQARAQKLLAGFLPHGPAAFFATDSKRVSFISADQPYDTIDVSESGQPPTTFDLLLDTSSSNTWIDADKGYLPTSPSITRAFEIYYGCGAVAGVEFLEQITLGGNLVAKEQIIGVAASVCGFRGDGVLGIGPVNLSSSGEFVPSVTKNLFDSGLIPTISIGISYMPDGNNVANGQITLGATDTAKFIGSVNYVPITKIEPSDKYWGIDADLTYSEDMPLLKLSAGIADIGTTFLLLASDAYKVYRRATRAEEDRATGLLTVTETQFAEMKSLFFTIGSETYELTPNAQIWPRRCNDIIGGEKDKIYLIVANMGDPSGNGLDFIIGFAFLQRFYSVFDTTNRRFGLARTKHTTAEIN